MQLRWDQRGCPFSNYSGPLLSSSLYLNTVVPPYPSFAFCGFGYQWSTPVNSGLVILNGKFQR